MARVVPETSTTQRHGAAPSVSAVSDVLTAELGGVRTQDDIGDGVRVGSTSDRTVQVTVREHSYRGNQQIVRRAIKALAERGYQVRVTGYVEHHPDLRTLITTLAVGPLPEDTESPTYDAGLVKARILCSPSPEFGVIGRYTVGLAHGETAWNPASTKADRALRGPATLDYIWFEDGGIDAHHLPAPVSPGGESETTGGAEDERA